jgi:acyl-CoA thioester hydrolase
MYRTPITPRVSETDGAGHINNTVVPAWLEAGRLEIFRLLIPELSFSDWRVALVNMNLDFLAQTYFQHPVEVRTWVERIGTKSFTLYEEIWQRDTLTVKATVTYVYFDYREQRSRALPEEAVRRLRAHLREDASSADG